MSDSITRLNAALEGRYRVERELGEGGMATVYLADDLKHERKVALKVLKPELAAVVGAERFLTEIKTTAALQHPHILPLFDSGEAGSFLFYVMPYVEGETLRNRLRRENQLPVDEAVRITTEVTEALEYAHGRGVIHRDIKPANILLQNGRVLVADFGIALAVEGTDARLTETGRSLGTPQYMSPEQATGEQHVGPASDIYSLGCVLYEMLVGATPHTASTAQGVLAKVLTAEIPSAVEARASVPSNVDAVIRKALSRLPADRFQRAKELGEALVDPHFGHGDTPGQADGRKDAARWKRLAFGSAAVAAVSLIVAGWSALASDPRAPVLKLSMALSGEGLVVPPNGSAVTMSPDGSTFLYGAFARAGRSDRWQLWVRRLDQFEATPVPGTEEGVTPVFSPDGSEIAFTQGGVRTPIQIVPVSGGPRRGVGEDVIRAGLAWGADGMLYYTRLGHGFSRVPAAGGDAEIVTALDTLADETGHRWIDVLPDGRSGVFSIGRSGPQESWDIGVVRFGEEHRVLTAGLYPRYTASGHLLWVLADGTLMAAPFDIDRLDFSGVPVSVVQNVNIGEFGAADYDVGRNGNLIYVERRRLEDVPVWVARDGTETEIPGTWVGALEHPRLSPDGTQFLVGITQEGGSDVWIKELNSGPLSRLTFGSSNYRAEWADGGRSVTFLSDREGQGVWRTPADGSGSATLVHDDPRFINEAFVTSDGDWLVYRLGSGGGRDLMARGLDDDTDLVALADTPFEESAFRVSPDRRWLAYVSNESGQNEIYVRPFPTAGGPKRQVSTEGGREPAWSPDGTELFYRDPSNQLIAVEVRLQPSFTVGARAVLFSNVTYKQTVTYNNYDVAPDGERFLMIRSLPIPGEIKLVQNFFEELRQRVSN